MIESKVRARETVIALALALAACAPENESEPEAQAEAASTAIQTSRRLAFAPPTLSSPITLDYAGTTAPQYVTLRANTDYIVHFTSPILDHGTVFKGGRNVVLIGGELVS